MAEVTKLYTKYLIENVRYENDCDPRFTHFGITAKVGDGWVTIMSASPDKKFLFRKSSAATAKKVIELMAKAVEIEFEEKKA